jgi:hypothetical protein
MTRKLVIEASEAPDISGHKVWTRAVSGNSTPTTGAMTQSEDSLPRPHPEATAPIAKTGVAPRNAEPHCWRCHLHGHCTRPATRRPTWVAPTTMMVPTSSTAVTRHPIALRPVGQRSRGTGSTLYGSTRLAPASHQSAPTRYAPYPLADAYAHPPPLRATQARQGIHPAAPA